MYEVEDFKDELYKDPNGDRTEYNNMYHNHTMNLVSCTQNGILS
jgi:hypothetical protein